MAGGQCVCMFLTHELFGDTIWGLRGDSEKPQIQLKQVLAACGILVDSLTGSTVRYVLIARELEA
jgi:hypothetical protein